MELILCCECQKSTGFKKEVDKFVGGKSVEESIIFNSENVRAPSCSRVGKDVGAVLPYACLVLKLFSGHQLF